tara:strand:- start:275 stop:1267 length:993 start_codon:yes stop_codon:yes gene_type:complete
MIKKSSEVEKINLRINNFILLYGKNEGQKNEFKNIILRKFNKDAYNYEEKEILDNPDSFLESVSSSSLFESNKIILIKRATDKILKIIEEIESKNLDDIIVINAGNLDKKSKLRSYFEKSKKYICVAFYPDNERTLSNMCVRYFQKKNISISQSNINLIVNKCGGDRGILFNELNKIEFFSRNGKNVNEENILKLINLSEDYSISELIDNCLSKNKKKTIDILNENNFTNEDCFLITRIFLNKAKKILKLSSDFERNNDINLTISSAKPPIFWKDKEITKQQIYKWKPINIKKLIYKINEMELLVKKNLNNSVNLITNFILEQSSTDTNN